MTERVLVEVVDTDLGPLAVAESGHGVLACLLDGSVDALARHVAERLRGAIVELGPTVAAAGLCAWITGDARKLPVVDLRGLSAFDTAVYRAVRAIRWGDTATYAEVARRVDRPGAARAVGGAMARCPLFPAVPCHRVVRAADGWSGWGGADARKRRWLDRER